VSPVSMAAGNHPELPDSSTCKPLRVHTQRTATYGDLRLSY